MDCFQSQSSNSDTDIGTKQSVSELWMCIQQGDLVGHDTRQKHGHSPSKSLVLVRE